MKWLIVNFIRKILKKNHYFRWINFYLSDKIRSWLKHSSACSAHPTTPFFSTILTLLTRSLYPLFCISSVSFFFHFNISLVNSLCRLYTLRFPRYATMWKRLWMVPEGVLNLLVMHPLEGRMVEIVFSSRGIWHSIVRRNRSISLGCTHTLTVSNTAKFSWTFGIAKWIRNK